MLIGITVIAAEWLDVLGIDRCLDAGGSYDNLKQSCDYARSHEAPPGISRSAKYIIGGFLAIAAGLGLLIHGRRLR